MPIAAVRYKSKGKSPQYQEYASAIRKRLFSSRVKPKILAYPKDITRAWEHKVTFAVRIYPGKGNINIALYATGKNAWLWKLNVEGTKAYKIKAKKGKVLAFPTGYKRKTPKRYKGARGSGAHGPMAFAKEVKHPAVEGTHHDIKWMEWAGSLIWTEVNKALKEGQARV